MGQQPRPSTLTFPFMGPAWRDQLPESLADSRTAELLEQVCDVDLDTLDVELPRGFGRDLIGGPVVRHAV